jgi:hypothetical protein
VRTAIARAGGTVLALPFHRYLDLPIAGNRRVLNPVPDYLGGDVITSSDPELGAGFREFSDPRESTITALLSRATNGQPVAAGLAAVGIRWIVVLHAVDWRSYDSLHRDPGLTTVVSGPTVDLLSVNGWRGPVVDDAGRSVPIGGALAPLKHLAASPPAVWAAPAAPGWIRGSRSVGRAAGGLLALPGGSGPLWFWPAGVVVLVDAACIAALVAVLSRRRGRRGYWRNLPAGEGRSPGSGGTGPS